MTCSPRVKGLECICCTPDEQSHCNVWGIADLTLPLGVESLHHLNKSRLLQMKACRLRAIALLIAFFKRLLIEEHEKQTCLGERSMCFILIECAAAVLVMHLE